MHDCVLCVFACADDTWLTVGLSGLIAVDMFNERNGSIIPELGQLGDCDVFFDDTMFDTASTSVGAMTAYLAQPQDIIVGAPRTASSEPVALVGGIQQVPQMSFWSTAPSFDDKFYNPYFMRTIPSDSAIGESIVAYFLDNDFRAVHVRVFAFGCLSHNDQSNSCLLSLLVTGAPCAGRSSTSTTATAPRTHGRCRCLPIRTASE